MAFDKQSDCIVRSKVVLVFVLIIFIQDKIHLKHCSWDRMLHVLIFKSSHGRETILSGDDKDDRVEEVNIFTVMSP